MELLLPNKEKMFVLGVIEFTFQYGATSTFETNQQDYSMHYLHSNMELLLQENALGFRY